MKSKRKKRYIYKITNLVNGKCYIGQTKNYKERIKSHLKERGSILLARAVKKYGVNNFKCEKLLICEINEVDRYERDCIKQYNSIENGYNIHPGGGWSNEDHARKIANSMKGHIVSEETRRKISKNHHNVSGINNPNYGGGYKLNLNAEQRKKRSEDNKGKNNPNYGKEHSKEIRKKISDKVNEYYKLNPPKKTGIYKKCLNCNKIFYVEPYRIKTNKYCSRRCMDNFMKQKSKK